MSSILRRVLYDGVAVKAKESDIEPADPSNPKAPRDLSGLRIGADDFVPNFPSLPSHIPSAQSMVNMARPPAISIGGASLSKEGE